MLYLVGGVPRVGKSKLAQLLLERKKVSLVDTDWIIHMLMYASPQLNVGVFKTFDRTGFEEKALKFYPFLYQFIKYNQFVSDEYTIEGDAFLPKQVSELQKEFKIKTCFLGTSNLVPKTLLNNPSKNNWIKRLTSEELSELCRGIAKMSNYVKNECSKYKIPYFDLFTKYNEQIEKAYKYLTE